MQVKYKAISPSNWKVGDVISDDKNNQYEITDAEEGMATLRILEQDERNKEVQGHVSI